MIESSRKKCYTAAITKKLVFRSKNDCEDTILEELNFLAFFS